MMLNEWLVTTAEHHDSDIEQRAQLSKRNNIPVSAINQNNVTNGYFFMTWRHTGTAG